MNYYHVVLGSKHIDLIQAYSEKHAVQIIEYKFGNPKQYSENHNYKAVRA